MPDNPESFLPPGMRGFLLLMAGGITGILIMAMVHDKHDKPEPEPPPAMVIECHCN